MVQEESFIESLMWAEKCWLLACSHPFSHPPMICFKFSQTGILWPTPKINPHEHENLWLFFILTIRFCPLHVDTRELYPSLSVLEGLFFLSAARKAHEPKAWKVAFSQWKILENVVGGLGDTHFFCMCKLAGQPPTLRLSGELSQMFQSWKRGWVGWVFCFLKSGGSWSVMVFERGFGLQKRTCEEN